MKLYFGNNTKKWGAFTALMVVQDFGFIFFVNIPLASQFCSVFTQEQRNSRELAQRPRRKVTNAVILLPTCHKMQTSQRKRLMCRNPILVFNFEQRGAACARRLFVGVFDRLFENDEKGRNPSETVPK
jgi:hypothetical protein